MKKAKIFLTALMLVATALFVAAQDKTVKGTVSDASTGEAIFGAAIQLKGNPTKYAVTDVNGAYTISVPSDGTLVVTLLGYKTTEVQVNGQMSVNVALETDNEMLEDVVVVAYGTVRREAKTGSVTAIKTEGMAEAPVASVDKLLSGKMAGVQVTAATGQPGASSQIRIRGTSSLNAGNEPLWVVDGIPVSSGNQSMFTNTSNAMAVINPNDIESITVLKDAAAASIYGSRAANGVILVTTKSGKSGKGKFTARVKYGVIQFANDNNFRPMTGSELLDWQRVAIVNAGKNPDDPTSDYYRPMSLITENNNNWLGEFIRLGNLQEYEINASAGSDKGRFYSSISYQKNEAVVRATDFQKLTARINSDYRLTNTLEIGTRVNLAYTMANDTPTQSLYYSNPFFAGLTILPWTPLYDQDGEYNVNISENSNTNPLYTAKYDDQWEKQYRVHGTAYLQWEPIRNLIFKTNNSVEGTFGEGRRYWYPDPGTTQGTLQVTTTQFLTLTTSNTATYQGYLGEHNYRVMLGQEAQRYGYLLHYMYGTVQKAIPYMSTSEAADDETDYEASKETLLSFFGMLDYNYANKYFLQASIREDGSSLFGSASKWGLFWSVGGSWNISKEDFMKNTSSWLDLLKIRASYGVNGNNNIAAYRAYGVYATVAYNGSASSILPSRPDNSSLSWEKNKTWNVGLDANFFSGRLNFQADVYSRITADMLLSKSVPYTSGFGSNFMNIGSMKNQGVEFQVDGDIISNRDLTWNIGFNLAYNKSTILDLGDADEMSADESRIKHKVGKSFYTYYLKDYYGVNPSNGEALFRHHEDIKDEEGNVIGEEITLTNDYNKASWIYAGSPEPKITGGFNTSLSYKGLNLDAFFEFKYGNKVYLLENQYVNSDGASMSRNQSSRSLNYWKKPGDTNCFPKPIAGNSTNSSSFATTRWLEDGSFLRIKDVTLSYTLPEKITKKINLGGVKVYVSALNLFTFHKVNWFDPERGVDGTGAGIHPMTKSFVGGIEVSF